MKRVLLVGLLFGTACASKASESNHRASDAGTEASPVAVNPNVGRACDDDAGASCAEGLICLREASSKCNGGAREVRYPFPGGYCTNYRGLLTPPVTDFDCPSGSTVFTLIPLCDSKVLKFCTTACTKDEDCRATEGYGCHIDTGLCVPPSLKP
jgi:hypothetical protein